MADAPTDPAQPVSHVDQPGGEQQESTGDGAASLQDVRGLLDQAKRDTALKQHSLAADKLGEALEGL